MKRISLLIAALCLSISSFSKDDNSKFTKAIEKTLTMLDTASTQKSVISVANRFERIASAEKDEWLAWYWAAYSNVVASYMEEDGKKKDSYLDKADEHIEEAMNLSTDNHELHVLQGWVYSARINVNPMSRGMKYGPMSGSELEKAHELNEDNPRYYYLTGMSLFYTPEMFGGDKEKACEMFNTALEKYDEFEPESDIHPNWGRDQVEEVIVKCKGDEDPENE